MTAILSKHCRIRNPEAFEVGEGSIVDDFCYFSTRVRIGRFTHIASGCSVAGGPAHTFQIGDFCSVSSGVRIWCSSNDFRNDLVVLKPPGVEIGDHPIDGDVKIGDMSGIGSNAVIMPANIIPEGVAIGALSFVPARFPFEPWTVYAGIPIRRLGARNRDNVIRQRATFESHPALQRRVP